MLYKFLINWDNLPKIKYVLQSAYDCIPLFTISEYLNKILIKESFINCPAKTLEYDCMVMSNPIDSEEIMITEPLLAIYFELASSWTKPIPTFALNSSANLMGEIIQQKWNESTNPHLLIEKIYYTFFKVFFKKNMQHHILIFLKKYLLYIYILLVLILGV
jgi:hypothetical protein